jgi:superfamily II DNA or RNA helicase
MLSIISKSSDINSFINIVKDTYSECKDYTTQVGNIGEELSLFYFTFNSRLFDVKNYYPRKLIPDNIKSKLNIGKQDLGTDAVIEHTNNKFSFIQCKFRTDITDTLKRDSISNMALEYYGSKKKYIQNLYLFSTVINQPSKVSDEEKENLKFILYEELAELDWDLFKTFVINYLSKNIKTFELLPLPKLYPHQKNALEICKYQILLTLLSACGTGKTIISLLLMFKEIQENELPVILVVPTLYLVSQTFRVFSLYCDIPKLLIGSDYENEKDEENKCNFPYQLTTDEKEIFEFLDKNKSCFIISTYQSIGKINKVLNDNELILGLTICDEAHLTASNNKNGCFSIVLKSDFQTKRKIFMTATAKVYKGKNDDCYSMDKEEIYGKSYNILSFRDAIKQEILCDYKIMLGVDSNNMNFKNLKVKGITSDAEYNISARECIMLNMIKKDMEEEFSRILICCNSHEKSKQFYKFCKEMLKDTNIVLHLMKRNATSLDKDKARKILKTNNKCIIFQVKIFSLGADIPEITTISLLDDKNSTIDIVQTMSRALRKHPSKEDIGARILIPVVVNERKENTYRDVKDGFEITMEKDENFFDKDEFKNVKNILTSIALYDDAIREEILMKMKGEKKEYKEEMKFKQRIFFESKYLDLDIINKIGIEMYDKLGNRTVFSWDNNLEIVLDYKENNDEKEPRYDDKINRGTWLSDQFKSYKKGELSFERKEKLEKYELVNLDDWNTKKEEKGTRTKENLDEIWKINLDIVLEYKKNNNNENPLTNDVENNSIWLNNQIQYYKKGQLSKERKKLLEKHKLVDEKYWNTMEEQKGTKSKEKLDEKWKSYLKIVLEYKEDKRENPTQNDIKNGGKWLSHQGTYYRTGNMTKERKELLEKHKLVDKKTWNTVKPEKGSGSLQKRNELWVNNLNYILDHKKIMNREPKRNEPGGIWLHNQRMEYQKGKMIKERKELLEKHKLVDIKNWGINK